MKHLNTFENFVNETYKPSDIILSDNVKIKIEEFVNKFRGILVKALAPFKGKSEEEIKQTIQSIAGSNEGWVDVKRIISKIFKYLSVGVAGLGMASTLFGCYQLAATETLTKNLEVGATGILIAIFLYVIHLVFATKKELD